MKGQSSGATLASRSKGNQNGCFNVRSAFRFCATWISQAMGSPWAFALASLAIIIWGVTGPHFHYSNTWQLVINTGTTIITFLMVFLIQNTQNRDTRAVQLKLDELLRALQGARNSLVNLESLSDEELDRLHEEFERLRGRAEKKKSAKSGEKEPSPRQPEIAR